MSPLCYLLDDKIMPGIVIYQNVFRNFCGFGAQGQSFYLL
jgi:hypothetical protein